MPTPYDTTRAPIITVSDIVPSGTTALVGDLWWAPTQGQLFVYYYDGNSYQWVIANLGLGRGGPTGPAGPTGPQGLPGVQGPTGATGAPGPQGPAGSVGPQGPQGVAGASGQSTVIVGSFNSSPASLPPSGLIPPGFDSPGVPAAPYQMAIGSSLIYSGAPIAPWATGDLFVFMNTGGSPGLSGWYDVGNVQGPAGPQGPTGAGGATGAPGPQGATGPTGATGPQGAPGTPGAPGSAGPTGPQGIQGNQGPIGPAGADGPVGPSGPTGATGPQGPQGATGATGPAGTSAVINIGDTPPGSPQINQLWWNSVLGTMFIYYNDGNSTQWVPAAPSATLPTIPARPVGRYGRNAGYASGNTGGSWLTVQLDTMVINDGAGTFASNVWTPGAGTWRFDGCIYLASAPSASQQQLGLLLSINNDTGNASGNQVFSFCYPGQVMTLMFSVIVKLSASDNVRLKYNIVGGDPGNYTIGGSNYTYLQGERINP